MRGKGNLYASSLLTIVMLWISTQLYAQPIIRGQVRIKDLINNKHILLKGFPDTLNFGGFTLIVEEYERGGNFDALSRSYKHLSGIGRIKFSCQTIFHPWPGVLWADAVFKPIKIQIVDSVQNEEREMTVKDATSLGIKARTGNIVDIPVPHYNDKAITLTRYLSEVAGVKRPDGIRVAFKDITVAVLRAGATKGVVTDGVAVYPSEQAVPAVPFSLPVHAGFRVEISQLRIFANNQTQAVARLILPNSLAQLNSCNGAGIDLGVINISPKCEFYKEIIDSSYGVFSVGNTTLAIAGKGYIADFSSSLTYGPIGKPIAWKGVVLLAGESKGTTDDYVVSNIGYMQARYNYTRAIVETSGLTAQFVNVGPFSYGTVQPLGYTIKFTKAVVNIAASKCAGGRISDGTIELPRTAVRQANDASVVLTNINMSIQPSMNTMGNAIVPFDMGLYWGDLIKAGGGDRKSFGVENINRDAFVFFSATPRHAFIPVSTDGKTFINTFPVVSPAALEYFGAQGVTFSDFGLLLVNTSDIPRTWKPNDPIIPFTNHLTQFKLIQSRDKWINVVTEGIHCNISSEIKESKDLQLGNPADPLYVGVTAFQTRTSTMVNNKPQFSKITLNCIESAVINCDFQSQVDIADPVKSIFAFKKMVFTSTAVVAGGEMSVTNTSLTYWGLKLKPKPGFSSAGLISVRTGQIVLTAAGLEEERHFAQPFWINWGEILANGRMGRLFFDYNSAGQQFDKFDYVHNAIELSPFPASPATDKPFLRVGGYVHLPFFGEDYLHIKDMYDTGFPDTPYNNRVVQLSKETIGSFLPTDSTVSGNWNDGLAKFDFILRYADSTQDGFTAKGTSLLRYLLGGAIGSTATMNSRGSCIRIGSDLMDQRSVALGPVANISNITRIWGCACIKNNSIDNLVVGGEVTNAANVSIATRAGTHLSAVLQVTPSFTKFTLDGEAYLSIMPVLVAMDVVVNGHMQLTFNHAVGFVEGEIAGKMRVAEGHLAPSPIFLQGSSFEAEGQMNWHLGADFQELQGVVSLEILNTGGGTGVGAGFYIGANAPKERAWVLVGTDPRYNLNISALPARLTGFYGSIKYSNSVNLYIISGGYDVFFGLGAFMNAPGAGGIKVGDGLPFVIGNLGGGIHGEILGGFVSASGYFNLQLIGPYPFSFEGTVGLEGCVLWVACKSVDITVGLNTTDGFYVD